MREVVSGFAFDYASLNLVERLVRILPVSWQFSLNCGIGNWSQPAWFETDGPFRGLFLLFEFVRFGFLLHLAP